MSAYIIVNLEVTDPAGFEEYKALVPVLIRKHGGEYLTRGGHCEVLEGGWKPNRLVVLRFPDRASALAFYHDSEYKPLIEMRQRTAKTDLVVIDGI